MCDNFWECETEIFVRGDNSQTLPALKHLEVLFYLNNNFSNFEAEKQLT